MTDTSGDPSYCERCGRELGAGDPAPLCSNCAMHEAEASLDRKAAAAAPARGQTPDQRDEGRKRLRRIATIVAIVVSLAVIVLEAPAMFGSFQPAKPRRDGGVVTDAKADACISNLWTVMSNVSEGRPYSGQPTCPVTGAAYVVTKDGNVTTVSCPNPDKHNLTSLYIRSDSRLPVVR